MSVRREHVDGIEIVTIDRPERRNALDTATVSALGDVLTEAEQDPATLVVVLTGAGDRAFCAGLDLSGGDRTRTAGADAYQRFSSSPYAKPVIGAANGTAVAGGFELLLACDLVVASDAAKFGIPEVKRGLVPGAGGTLLPLRIPMAIAAELALTGELISARRAYELGLVNRVVPASDVLESALELGRIIAANGPLAVRRTKQLLAGTRELPVTECWTEIRAAVSEIFATEDAHEGGQAFLERRAPLWKGR